MTTTKLFTTHTTQAVRLPKDVAFPHDVVDVDVIVVGDARLIVPAGRGWDYYFDHASPVSEDFMRDREQPAPQERSAL
jgi:antitoxin VapB